jgi:hypothetical protein
MKKVISIFVFLFAVLTMYSQDIVGTWEGSFTVETPNGDVSLRIVFHVTATDNGYTSTLDSPDQDAFGIATDATTYLEKELTVKITQLDFVYTGKLTDARTIDGSFVQMGQTFELDLTKKEE